MRCCSSPTLLQRASWLSYQSCQHIWPFGRSRVLSRATRRCHAHGVQFVENDELHRFQPSVPDSGLCWNYEAVTSVYCTHEQHSVRILAACVWLVGDWSSGVRGYAALGHRLFARQAHWKMHSCDFDNLAFTTGSTSNVLPILPRSIPGANGNNDTHFGDFAELKTVLEGLMARSGISTPLAQTVFNIIPNPFYKLAGSPPGIRRCDFGSRGRRLDWFEDAYYGRLSSPRGMQKG